MVLSGQSYVQQVPAGLLFDYLLRIWLVSVVRFIESTRNHSQGSGRMTMG